MKKFTYLLLFTLLFSFCSSTNTEMTETESSTNDVIIFTKGLGKSTSEYVSNWNKLISEIANDEDTVLYFSINPDEVRWASPEQTVLFYQFGKLSYHIHFQLNGTHFLLLDQNMISIYIPFR